jgi:Integrase core domain
VTCVACARRLRRGFYAWAYRHGVYLDFIRSGRPTENGYIESFNGRLRDQCLNVQVFLTGADARDQLGHWRQDYNRVRPHSALGASAPEQLVRASQSAAAKTESCEDLREGLSRGTGGFEPPEKPALTDRTRPNPQLPIVLVPRGGSTPPRTSFAERIKAPLSQLIGGLFFGFWVASP